MARTPLNVRIDVQLLEKLKDLAKNENRTLSNLVDTALKKYLLEAPKNDR